MMGIEDLVRRMVELSLGGESAEAIVALAEADLAQVQDLQQPAQVRAAIIAEFAAQALPGAVRDEVIVKLGALSSI
jgi:hypothetical protein